MKREEFKVGDRVIVNDRGFTHRGRIGTVRYMSGGKYWIEFDDSKQIELGFYIWRLEPLEADADRLAA